MNTDNDNLNSFFSDLMPNTFKKDSFSVQKNWKDALISQLYSTLDFLKTEIKEKKCGNYCTSCYTYKRW